MEREDMSISELAERVGVSQRTIRYYIEEGLLPAPIGVGGRQQTFSHEHEIRLRAAKRLRDLGFTVSGARAVLARTPVKELETRLEELSQLQPGEPIGAVWDLWAAPPSPRVAETSVSFGAPRERWAHAREREKEAESSWRRVALAPGVELHYQPSANEQRDRAIGAIAQDAMKRLAAFD